VFVSICDDEVQADFKALEKHRLKGAKPLVRACRSLKSLGNWALRDKQ
jgi:hypothetical protein